MVVGSSAEHMKETICQTVANFSINFDEGSMFFILVVFVVGPHGLFAL